MFYYGDVLVSCLNVDAVVLATGNTCECPRSTSDFAFDDLTRLFVKKIQKRSCNV
jgi:hypothetical protein